MAVFPGAGFLVMVIAGARIPGDGDGKGDAPGPSSEYQSEKLILVFLNGKKNIFRNTSLGALALG